MGNLFTEIRTFKRFANLKEQFSAIKTALFGDELIYFLYDDDIDIFKELTSKYQTMNNLMIDLNKMEVMPIYDHVFFSIGTDDRFENKMDILPLVKSIRRVFPNANLYVIKAIIDEDYFYSYEEEEVIKNLDLQISDFYEEFLRYNVKIVGSYNSAEGGLGITKQKMNTIKNEIAKYIIQDVIDMNPEKDVAVDEPFVNVTNKKIKGDDETDFDTIYEFLERFERIYKSGNSYSKRTNSSYKLDIEQIQIALNFVMKSDIEITGKYDMATEKEVMEYQSSKNLEETGICDEETLEELFYDLKIKGFDEEDLSFFLKQIGVFEPVEIDTYKRFEGGVDSVWISFTDKIIDNFEGGYWNNDRTKPITEKCPNHPYEEGFSDNSGETMFGIDRRAGNWDDVDKGREYFGIIDDEKEDAGSMVEFCKKWKYNYRGGNLESELKKRAGELMRVSFERNKNYLSDKALDEVEGNKRLLFHFAYACWNGSGHFQDFANDINKAVSNGIKGDALVDVAVQGRNKKFGSGDWARANQKVVNMIKNDPSLEN